MRHLDQPLVSCVRLLLNDKQKAHLRSTVVVLVGREIKILCFTAIRNHN